MTAQAINSDIFPNETFPGISDWKTLLEQIGELIEEHDLASAVVFHGTSTKRLTAIQEGGLRPCELGDAYFRKRIDFDDPDFGYLGSFWGKLETAAWYAEDTVIVRDNCQTKPILIVTDPYELALEYPLYPDRASFEEPVDRTLPISTNRDLANAWEKRGARFTWKRGLEEIGAIFAVHDEYLDTDMIAVIQDIDDFKQFIAARNLADISGLKRG